MWGGATGAQEAPKKALPPEPGAQVNPNESWIEERDANPVKPGEPAPGTVEREVRKQAAETLRMSLAALQTGTTPGAIINNGTVALGVHNRGHLNYSGTGVRHLPNKADALIPGCPCEGWGVADANSRIAGYANRSMGTRGLAVESFEHDTQTATSVVRAGDTFRVSHEYAPASDTPNLYEATVTIENTSESVVDARYRRVLDWDVPPRVFREYVTNNDGDSPSVSFMSDNGFASANPLAGPSSLRRSGDMTDFGPADQGALFDFQLGSLEPGKSTSFKIFYGAGPDEATVRGALERVGAEAYSLGKPSSYRGKEEGIPNTFTFGFKREASQAHSYVAIGDSTTTGHSISDCPLGEGSYEYQWGCPVEPGDGPPYPELVAQKLGSPYDDLNRVGVWGYTIKDAVRAYEFGNQTGTDRRDGTQWESQLHAVEDARDLVTVSLGANDMRQSDIGFWLVQAATFDTQDEADKLIEELTRPRKDRQSYMDTLFEVLSEAHEEGAEVVVNLYYNPFHEPYAVGTSYPKCSITHETAKTITDTLNKELRSRAEAEGMRVADFGVKFNPPGDEDHGAGGPDPSQSWVYGNECDVDGVITGILPTSWNPFGDDFMQGGGRQGIAEKFDPHPNPAGSNAMAEKIEEVVGQ